MPLGVTRQSAVFTLKVYHAEDLPQSEWVSHKRANERRLYSQAKDLDHKKFLRFNFRVRVSFINLKRLLLLHFNLLHKLFGSFTDKAFTLFFFYLVDTGIGRSFKKFFSFFSSDDDKEVRQNHRLIFSSSVNKKMIFSWN